MQGRVMAFHQMAWFGTTPIGALLVGWVIEASSPRVPFMLGSAAALACAAALIVGGRAPRRAQLQARTRAAEPAHAR
jgi:uncharacterized membrane protein AbrB (regulator of aidB expression)